ncbi:MAG: N-acetylmuramoyl-L-alanine amidase [Acidobacteria bacterium]|nr:N-acetylmuramoyl-L-alanine amidase [Acidobacteriota bacterium]
MTLRSNQSWFALLLASLLAFPAVCFPATSAASRRARAQAAYERATRMRTTLASRPTDTRLKAEYEKVIQVFRSVHWADPGYHRTPVALEAVGELYAEMGRAFSSEYYFRAAIKAYEYLMAEYPNSSMARDGHFAIGEIHLSDLKDEGEARKTFEEYLKKYPRTGNVTEARAKLKQIEQLIVDLEGSRAKAAENRTVGSLPQVTAIRQWVGPNYTRIVVNVEGEVKFDTLRLPNPDRIVLDLANTRLSSTLVGKIFPVGDGFLRQVRVGQYQPTVTRVVLDVEKIEDYSIFSLPNPFRLVVDINGPPPEKETVAEAQKPESAPLKEPETVASRRPPPVDAGTKADKSKPPVTQPAPAVAEPEKSSGPKGVAGDPEAAPEGARETKETASLKPPPEPAKAVRKTEPAKPSSAEAPPIKTASPTGTGSRTLTRALGLKIARIVIDPGHGGHDTGTIGPTGLKEKDVVLDVAQKLKKLIEEKAGAEVIMTRTEDTFIPLEERTAIANEKTADLFISIHANASRSQSARGIETYYLNFTSDREALEVAARENATTQESVHELQNLIKKIAMTEKIEESQEFAAEVQREVYTRLIKAGSKQRNRGVKKAPFVVLIGANMPSILAEISFLTNPYDERQMKKAEHRERIADALYRGIARYVDRLGGVRAMQQASTGEAPAASASNF